MEKVEHRLIDKTVSSAQNICRLSSLASCPDTIFSQPHLRIQNIRTAAGSKEGIDGFSGHVTHASNVHGRLEVLVGKVSIGTNAKQHPRQKVGEEGTQ